MGFLTLTINALFSEPPATTCVSPDLTGRDAIPKHLFILHMRNVPPHLNAISVFCKRRAATYVVH